MALGVAVYKTKVHVAECLRVSLGCRVRLITRPPQQGQSTFRQVPGFPTTAEDNNDIFMHTVYLYGISERGESHDTKKLARYTCELHFP